MKTVLTSGYAFTASAKTLDFTGTTGFDVKRLYAVLNLTQGVLIYAVGTAGLGYSALNGSVLSLAFNTTAHANTDALMVLYEAPSTGAQDSTLQSMLTQLVALVAAAQSTTPTSVSGSVTANLGTLNGAALDSSLQSILTVLQAQRAETLWTDDTNAFFVRVDKGGAITWTDPSGNTSAGPGTGARPAAGTSAIVDSSRYQATAAATGYSIGDYLSHIVTTDPATGAVIGHFWLNVTTEAKLASAPAAANITPIASLPAGAATSALQTTGNGSLSAIASALAGLLSIQRPPLTFTLATGGPIALTSAWQKVVTTSAATKGLRIAALTSASAYDIEWVAYPAGTFSGGALPTDAVGEPVSIGEDFAAGLPIGDVYLKSASGQKALVKTGA